MRTQSFRRAKTRTPRPVKLDVDGKMIVDRDIQVDGAFRFRYQRTHALPKCIIIFSKMKSASPQFKARFYTVRGPKNLSLQHNWLKSPKLSLFVAKAVSYRGAGFSRC